MEEGAIVVESTDISSSPEKEKRKTDGNSSPSRPSPFVILINMPTHDYEAKHDIDRWYTVEIPADGVDGTEGSISEVWRGKTVVLNSSFALLGSDLYRLGGEFYDSSRTISCVWKINIRNPTDSWISVQPMITSRAFPHALVLGGKLYVFSGDDFDTTALGGEVYDPMTDSWQALPDPPCHIGRRTLSAALENPNRILVASLPELPEDDDGEEPPSEYYYSANFFIYDVQNCSWKMLDTVRRELHLKCPMGIRGKAVAVGNYLYWITDHALLLAYDYQLDLWLTGNFRGLKYIPFLEYTYEPDLPGFFHLENERFCIIQRTVVRDRSDRYVHCILFDVSPMPDKKKLRISLVSDIKYHNCYPSLIGDSLLILGAEEDLERWYTMKIHTDAVDGTEGPICEAWRRHTLQENSSRIL